MSFAIKFSNGLGNTILLTSLLNSLYKASGKAIPLLPRQGLVTRGVEVIPSYMVEIHKNSRMERHFTDILEPQAMWPDWRSNSFHERDFYLSLMDNTVPQLKEIFCQYDDSIFTDEFKNKPRITLINGFYKGDPTMWDRKLWDKFNKLADILYCLFPGVEICKVGLSDEMEDVECTDYTNSNYNLLQTCGVIKHSSLVIANDTGLMHAADALRVPLITLFGATTIAKNGPVQTKFEIVRTPKLCAPCLGIRLYRMCKTRDCMSEITVESVVHSVLSFTHKLGLFSVNNFRGALYEEGRIPYKRGCGEQEVPDIHGSGLSKENEC